MYSYHCTFLVPDKPSRVGSLIEVRTFRKRTPVNICSVARYPWTIKSLLRLLVELEMKSTAAILYNNPHNIQCCFLNWCVTWWIVFQFESSPSPDPIRMKINQNLIAWWDMAWRNWVTAILSHHGHPTWSSVINDQGIRAEKIECLLFSFENNKEL